MLGKTKVKYIQSLGQKKFRQSEGLFLAEGPKLVMELAQEVPNQVVEVFALAQWISEHKSQLDKINVQEISEIELSKISQLSTPNNVVAVVRQFQFSEEINLENKIVLALDGIQDPGNMGTIIRIADWFGVQQIVCSLDSAEIYNPKVVQATMGSIARVQVIYKDLHEWLVSINGTVNIYATVLDGKNIGNAGKIAEGIILVGNESKGISASLLQQPHQKITIGKKGRAESLNAAVATGIVLSHLT